MLCSISTSTTSSTTSTSTSTSGRSTSNWLDKLRCSKGFPTFSSTDLDLEQFLAHHTNHNNPIPPENLQLSDPKTTHQPQNHPSSSAAVNGHPTAEIIHEPPSQEKQLFSIMNNVLAELFVMGGDSSTKKKCSRKQTNPRLCVPLDPPSDFSNSANYDHNHGSNENAPVPRKNDSASPMSDDNSGVGLGKELVGDQQVKMVENVNCAEEEEQEGEEDDNGCSTLSGFSRTEVTVIDTSFARWKFEKMLFRKKNVWKVRDKKGKTMSSGKKKRKASNSIDSENVCGGIDEVKKPKILDGECGLSKKGGDGANKEEYHENDKSQTGSRKISDTFGKALKKKQATLNLESGSSSVVLIKNIPTGKKSGTSIPRSCPKSTQRQFKE